MIKKNYGVKLFRRKRRIIFNRRK